MNNKYREVRGKNEGSFIPKSTINREGRDIYL
jgi:hypothetical protein